MRTSALLLFALLAAGVMPAAQAQQGVSLATGLTDFTTWSKFGGATAYNLTPVTASPTAIWSLRRPPARETRLARALHPAH